LDDVQARLADCLYNPRPSQGATLATETLSMTKRTILLEALASTPADVARLVRGLDETAAVWRADGGWSCRDVVAHLAHIEPLYLARLRRVVAEDEPTVAALLPDKAAHDRDLPVLDLAQSFDKARCLLHDWLCELSPADWQRPAIHETNGRTTLRFLVQDLVAHDIEHTAQLVTILGRWRAASRPLAGRPEGER
jgi:uncharacterized damage-inducible protein DinB